MLLNGQRRIFNSDAELLQGLKSLPSSISERTLQETVFYYQDAEALSLATEGVNLLLSGEENNDRGKIKTAKKHFMRAAEINETKQDDVALADTLFNRARASVLLGYERHAVLDLYRAARIQKKYLQLDLLLQTSGEIFFSLRQLKQKDKKNSVRWDYKIRKIRKLSASIFRIRNKERINHDAFRVEQNEVGFSADTCIGTDNICDCVCLMIRDPVSCKTALLHIDATTKPDTLPEILKHMPQNHSLQARIVGARYGAAEESTAKQNSEQNLNKVTTFLTAHQIDLLSCDIYDQKQPYALVVDPKTFVVREEIPGQKNADEHIANFISHFTSGERPLHVTFDLTKSTYRRAHYVSESALFYFNDMIKKHDVEEALYKDLETRVWKPQLPVMAEGILNTLQAYRTASEVIKTAMKEHFDHLKAEGITLSTKQKLSILELLEKIPVYIGENSPAANQILIDFIKTQFLSVNESGAVVPNFDGLLAIKNKMHPDILFSSNPQNIMNTKPLSPLASIPAP